MSATMVDSCGDVDEDDGGSGVSDENDDDHDDDDGGDGEDGAGGHDGRAGNDGLNHDDHPPLSREGVPAELPSHPPTPYVCRLGTRLPNPEPRPLKPHTSPLNCWNSNSEILKSKPLST